VSRFVDEAAHSPPTGVGESQSATESARIHTAAPNNSEKNTGSLVTVDTVFAALLRMMLCGL